MLTVLEDRAFWLGVGSAIALLFLVVASRGLTGRWWAGAGDIATVATLIGTAAVFDVPVELVAGVALLGLGGLVATRTHRFVGAALFIPGGVLVALAVSESAPRSAEWVHIVVGVAAASGAALSDVFDESLPRLTGLCIAIAAAGVLVTVPDTEAARALAGAAGISVLVGLAPDLRPSPAGTAAFAGVLTWNAGVGGWPRDGAVVGGVACFGVLALGPVVRFARSSWLRTLIVQCALVAIIARVAGLRDGALPAALICTVAFAGAGVVLVWPRRPASRVTGSGGRGSSRAADRARRAAALPPPRRASRPGRARRGRDGPAPGRR
jgi:hypothetical protein